jgi:hypothetical protein
MQKVLIYIVGVVIVLVGGFFILNNYIYTQKQGDNGFQDGYKDIAYTINGSSIDLEDGYAESDGMVGSTTTKLITKHFGNEAEGDLTEDGISDIAFVLTQEPEGGTPTYYVVAGVREDGGSYRGTSAVSLGENVTINALSVAGGRLEVSYTQTMPGSGTTTQSTRDRTRFLAVSGGELVSVPE